MKALLNTYSVLSSIKMIAKSISTSICNVYVMHNFKLQQIPVTKSTFNKR